MATIQIPDAASAIPPIVLLVHGDPVTRQSYRSVLESSGLWVEDAAEPASALQAAIDLRPNVIVTDVTFDDRPAGLAFLRTVKRESTTADIPIVVIDEEHPPHELQPFPAANADLLLAKPVVPDELLVSVQNVLAASPRTWREPAEDTFTTENERTAMLQSASVSNNRGDAFTRRCPECRRTLDWIERGRLGGTEYDYYRWCRGGCGLYCFDRSAGAWVRLA